MPSNSALKLRRSNLRQDCLPEVPGSQQALENRPTLFVFFIHAQRVLCSHSQLGLSTLTVSFSHAQCSIHSRSVLGSFTLIVCFTHAHCFIYSRSVLELYTLNVHFTHVHCFFYSRSCSIYSRSIIDSLALSS